MFTGLGGRVTLEPKKSPFTYGAGKTACFFKLVGQRSALSKGAVCQRDYAKAWIAHEGFITPGLTSAMACYKQNHLKFTANFSTVRISRVLSSRFVLMASRCTTCQPARQSTALQMILAVSLSNEAFSSNQVLCILSNEGWRYHPTVYPSICSILLQGGEGIPADCGREAGVPLDGSPVDQRADTWRRIHIHTLRI